MGRTEILVVVGQGYVGLPIAMRAVEAGFDVIGVDVDKRRVGALSRGNSYVEDISDARLRDAMKSGRYRVETRLDPTEKFDFAVITVPTPLKESLPDLSFIEAAASMIGPAVTVGSTVVLESTTYPGTTDELLVPLLESASGLQAGDDFYVGYSPERIDPGNQKWTFETTPKVVAGINAASLQRVTLLYSRLVDQTVSVSGTKEAELTKLLENTFRHVNIALVNELAVFAHQLGIDIWEAINAADTKPFGYMRFTPGPGVGGHCLPVDPSYLSWEVRRKLGRSFRFVELANDVNDHMPDYVVQRLVAGLNKRGMAVTGSKILILGLSYKRDTGDIRESPALRLVELLRDLGADLSAVDPYVEAHRVPEYVKMTHLTSDTVEEADAVVIVTDHEVFDYDLVARSGRWVLDTRNRVPQSSSVERL